MRTGESFGCSPFFPYFFREIRWVARSLLLWVWGAFSSRCAAAVPPMEVGVEGDGGRHVAVIYSISEGAYPRGEVKLSAVVLWE